MISIDLSSTVVVFDLDDTLYSEIDYHQSGLNEIIIEIDHIYGKNAADRFRNYEFSKSKKDVLQEIVYVLDLPIEVKESLLWMYRLHPPKIALSESNSCVLAELEISCKKVAILTDGRSVSQRQKINSLKLNHLPLYISEEYASEKPNTLRFLKIMNDFPASSYVYIGDNPKKDFLAPNELNWKTVGLIGNGKNIHSQECSHLPLANHPNNWIANLKNLLGVLC